MNKDEFISQYGHRTAFCEAQDAHGGHDWEFPGIGKVWCDGRLEAFMLRGDRSIRPLLCDGNAFQNAPHQPHVWEETEGGFLWSCSGAVLMKSIGERYGVEHSIEEHDPDKIAKVKDRLAKLEMPSTSSAIAKWADPAMFEAEPMPTANGPQVFLLWMTPDPLGAIAAACKMYKGEVVRDLSTITDAERLEFLEQVQKTKLKAPFEFVKFHFMIEGVTRAFTHQMVRQRTAVYAQESLRFAVKSDFPVALPPSLAGTDDYQAAVWQPDIPATVEERMRAKWEEATSNLEEIYSELVEMGMPAEDARGLLPHNITTRLHYSTDLRALLDHAGNRLCTQAQFEWRLVFARLVEAIRSKDYGEGPGPGGMANGTTHVWRAKDLTDLFNPVCYQTGKCEFKANFDRACSIRDRVDAFESAGIPSNGWHSEGWVDKERSPLAAIKPGEWLLDHTAARRAE